jgi:hypothetical protein
MFMKKMIFAFACALVLCACNETTETTNDSVIEDTVVDTTVVDTTVAADTTMTLEGTYSGLK